MTSRTPLRDTGSKFSQSWQDHYREALEKEGYSVTKSVNGSLPRHTGQELRNEFLRTPAQGRRRATFIPVERNTLLNGVPWGTIDTNADLNLVKQWITDGLDLGILMSEDVEFADDTVFLTVSAAAGMRVVNFNTVGQVA